MDLEGCQWAKMRGSSHNMHIFSCSSSDVCPDVMLRPMQVVQKQEEKELKESGLEGKDAFSELVKLSSNGASSGNGATHQNDPREDLERLYRDAAEGIVVAGREATWEATRPMVLPAGESQKLRGFIDYRRCAMILPLEL